MIQGIDIHKSFGPLEVLKGLHIEVKAGEVVAVVGPSGAGKTTLLQILGTLDRPNRGSVFINGTKVSALGQREQALFRNRHIGFCVSVSSALAGIYRPGKCEAFRL